MEIKVVTPKDARAFFEGPELDRMYFQTEKITFGTCTLHPGDTGAVDNGHPNGNEVFFVVKGNVILRTPNDNRCYELSEGDAILMPEGVPHELTNIGEGMAVVSFSLAPSEL